MDFVLDWVSSYGYFALYFLLMMGIVGLPIPDETLLVFCGYLISKGRMHPAATWAVALAGSMSGITVSYTVGRTLGLGVVHRYGRWLRVTEERLHKVHDWFHRIGHWALVAGYFIAGVRHFTALVAGTSKLELRTFAAYAYAGAVLWVTTFLTLGYFLGENWARIAAVLHRYIVDVSIGLTALCILYYLWRRRKNSRAEAQKASNTPV